MKNLTKNILANSLVLVPGAFYSKGVQRLWQKEDGKEPFWRSFSNALLTGISGGGLALYLFISGSNGSLNYQKGSELQQEKKEQRELVKSKWAYESFLKMDQNKDSLVDSTEFDEHYKSRFPN